MSSNITVLLIEDNRGDNLLLQAMLSDARRESFKVLSAYDLAEGIRLGKKQMPDIILIDLGLPDSEGMESFNKIYDACPDIPIIVMTGFNDEDTALEAVRRGAQDFIVKGQAESSLLIRALKYAIQRKHLEQEREELILKLKDALGKIKTLRGLLPICSFCKKIRDDHGYWKQIEEYVTAHADVNFSHSICPECAHSHYPDLYNEPLENGEPLEKTENLPSRKLKDLTKKIILITGVNRGMGREMTETFCAAGARVLMVVRNEKEGKVLLKEMNERHLKADLFIADMGKTGDIEKLYEKISRKYSHIDILINNAAVKLDTPETRIKNLELEKLKKSLDVNLIGPLWICRLFLPLLEKSENGRILNISSGLAQLSGERPNYYPAYSISKTALNALTRLLDQELEDTNTLVFSIDPGWVKTDMGGPDAKYSIREGIQTAFHLATEEANKLKSGAFYHGKKVVDW